MTAPAAYLRRVMLNEHVSNGRRLKRMVRIAPVEVAPEPSVPPATATIDLRDEAWRWLATLKPLQRAVLVLRFYEDLPDAEIAQLLGCAQATVRSHASRGLAALRCHLSSSGTGVEDR
jgi:RNA polymerase sigma factor (sigma-70 family)